MILHKRKRAFGRHPLHIFIQRRFVYTYLAFEKSVVHPDCLRDPPLPARGTADPDVGPDPIAGPDNRSGSQARPDMFAPNYELWLIIISLAFYLVLDRHDFFSQHTFLCLICIMLHN